MKKLGLVLYLASGRLRTKKLWPKRSRRYNTLLKCAFPAMQPIYLLILYSNVSCAMHRIGELVFKRSDWPTISTLCTAHTAYSTAVPVRNRTRHSSIGLPHYKNSQRICTLSLSQIFPVCSELEILLTTTIATPFPRESPRQPRVHSVSSRFLQDGRLRQSDQCQDPVQPDRELLLLNAYVTASSKHSPFRFADLSHPGRPDIDKHLLRDYAWFLGA